MSGFSFSHLSGPQVLDGYSKAKASSRVSEALVLAYLGEIDARKLFLEAGYSSMYAFVIAEFDLTDDVAKKRIRLARAAYAYPPVFPMLSDGRLNLSTFLMLVPYLNHANVDDLLGSAIDKTRRELELLLAARFPSTELMSWTMGGGEACTDAEQNCETLVAPGPPEWECSSPPNRPSDPSPSERSIEPTSTAPVPGIEQPPISSPPRSTGTSSVASNTTSVTSGTTSGVTSGTTSDTPRVTSAPPTPPPTRVTAIAAHAYGVQFMMEKEAHDDLEYLRSVLGHEAPTIAKVFALALKSLRRDVDKRKFAITDRPRRPRATKSTNPHHIPTHIRRAVRVRDNFRCSFMGRNGKRCDARAGLQLDHIVPIAQGGKSTVDNLRLLCRAHNQHAADRAFGVVFMARKRTAARRSRRAAGSVAGPATRLVEPVVSPPAALSPPAQPS